MASSDELLAPIVSHYYRLQSQLFNTVLAASRNDLSKNELLRQLAAIQEIADGLGASLSSVVPTKLYNACRATDSTTAMKALQVPELLELILENTSIFDVVNVYQTCHALRAIIDASSKLQTQLFLRPTGILANNDTTPTPHALVKYGTQWDGDGNFIWMDDQRCYDDGMLYICFRRSYNSNSRDKTPPLKFGQTWGKMQICQPALMAVAVERLCDVCEDWGGDFTFDRKFSTGKELTFGDLWDEARDAFDSNDPCSICRDICHRVVFAAIDDA